MLRKLKYWNFHSNHYVVNGGRIVICWNPVQVDCEILLTLPQIVHCPIKNKTSSKQFICSFVYGANNLYERRDLCSSLISWGVNNKEP